MIKEHNVVPLFGIPLCQTQIKPYEESEKFIKEKLDYELRSHKVSYISKDDYVLDKDNLLPLKTEILQQVSEFMHGYLDVHEKHKFVLTTSWCNKYEQNQYIQEHYHSNSLISGVLFLTDCKDTSNIVFHKDKNHTNIFTDTVRLDHKEQFDFTNKRSYLYHQSRMAVCPKKWDLMLFPSFLNHSVEINASPNDVRYTLSFNTWVQGEVGGGHSKLKL